MKSLKLITGIIAIIGLTACSQKTENNNKLEEAIISNSQKEIENVKEEYLLSAKIFKQLDLTLSPFEDMTEYALNKNDEGIKKSLNQVLKAKENKIFEANITPESIDLLYQKLNQLEEYVLVNNHQQVALLSAEIFEFNTSNFIDADKIENQIKIEHLDYLGFQTLALLNQDQINWKQLENTITDVEKVWSSLSKDVDDHNLKDSFEYLFAGLHLSVKNKDDKMAKILASMDLSLVDVLENAFE
ncbi:MAG: hypothetical protein H6587_02520 [Flavobacteriales bacterium]|nr:hypothetical protein [Flavobacteriales bacterium]